MAYNIKGDLNIVRNLTIGNNATVTAGLIIGSATGGSQGTGTVNIASDYYINGIKTIKLYGPITITLSGTAIDTGTSPTGVPSGWTVTTPTNASVSITHNLNKYPGQVLFFGQTVVSGTNRAARVVGAATNTLTFATSNLNQFTLGAITNSSVGAASGATFDIMVVI